MSVISCGYVFWQGNVYLFKYTICDQWQYSFWFESTSLILSWSTPQPEALSLQDKVGEKILFTEFNVNHSDLQS